MKRKEIARLIPITAVLIFLVIPFASAQTTLVPNITLENEFIHERGSQWYEAMSYEVDLTAGHWTVVIGTMFDLEINITVATDSSMITVIAESGSGWGHFPEAEFDLSTDTTVYIQIQENSVYGDSAGFYNIGVYDDEHVTTVPTTATYTFTDTTFITTTDPFGFLNIIGSFFMIFGIIVIAVLIIGVVVCLRMRSSTSDSSIQIVQAPHTAIPDRYKARAEEDDGLRMVRIQTQCPECNAALSQETIDWVGPLEAKCEYCGATVVAKFEKI
jgi:hypothetical protein